MYKKGIADRLENSINARVIYPCVQKFFKRTKYAKKLRRYKNKYVGERCFFIGNGPSLNAYDLTRLHNQGEITFAFNRIYNIFDETLWRPTFYISQDEKMLKGCDTIVDKLPLKNKFIPIQLHWYHNIDIHDATYFNINWKQGNTLEEYLFSKDISQEMYSANTVMYTAAQMAAYMGFSEIYLLGVDHNFRVSQNDSGEIIVDETVSDYFTDKYNPDKDNLYIPNLDKSTITYLAMKKYCDEMGIKVVNATRGGKLDVFPRNAFDELMKDI